MRWLVVLSMCLVLGSSLQARATVYERIFTKAVISGDLKKADEMFAKGVNLNTTIRYSTLYNVKFKSFKYLIDKGLTKVKENNSILDLFLEWDEEYRYQYSNMKDFHKKVTYLIDKGFSSKFDSDYGYNRTLDRAVRNFTTSKKPSQKYLKTFEYYLKNGDGTKTINKIIHISDPVDPSTYKSEAIDTKSPELFRLLIKYGLNINEKMCVDSRDCRYWNSYPLSRAVAFKDLNLVKSLLKKGAKGYADALKTAQEYELDEIELYLMEHK